VAINAQIVWALCSTPTAAGQTHVADFEEITDPTDRELVQRDAYERVRYLLAGLGIGDTP
jgi:hypothetical protein